MDVSDYATEITIALLERVIGSVRDSPLTAHELISDGARACTRRAFTRNHGTLLCSLNYIERNEESLIGTTDRVFDLQDARETARTRAHAPALHMRARSRSLSVTQR